jgi:hypothetical protein
MNGLISALTIGSMLMGTATYGYNAYQQTGYNTSDNQNSSFVASLDNVTMVSFLGVATSNMQTDSSNTGRTTSTSINTNVSNSNNTGGINTGGSVGTNGKNGANYTNYTDASLSGTMRFDNRGTVLGSDIRSVATNTSGNTSVENSMQVRGSLVGF